MIFSGKLESSTEFQGSFFELKIKAKPNQSCNFDFLADCAMLQFVDDINNVLHTNDSWRKSESKLTKSDMTLLCDSILDVMDNFKDLKKFQHFVNLDAEPEDYAHFLFINDGHIILPTLGCLGYSIHDVLISSKETMVYHCLQTHCLRWAYETAGWTMKAISNGASYKEIQKLITNQIDEFINPYVDY